MQKMNQYFKSIIEFWYDFESIQMSNRFTVAQNSMISSNQEKNSWHDVFNDFLMFYQNLFTSVVKLVDFNKFNLLKKFETIYVQ